MNKRIALTLVVALSGLLTSCAEEAAPEELTTTPQVLVVEKSALLVGETLHFYGKNFLTPDEGKTKLTFEGTFYWFDEAGNPVPEKVSPFTIAPMYDGYFEEAGTVQVNGQTVPVPVGTDILRWNRFGPFKVPFGSGYRPGVFKGTVTAVNHVEGEAPVASVPTEISIEVKPSIIIRKFEPVIDVVDGKPVTIDCGEPALRAIEGMPYIMEVEAIGIDPDYFKYEISGVNGSNVLQTDVPSLQVEGGWWNVTHQSNGSRVDRVGDATHHEGEIMIVNALADHEGFAHVGIRVTAIDSDNDRFVTTAIPIRVVRPMGFHFDGQLELAEYYDPVPVHGPIVGDIGTSVSYAESKSESRQQGASVTVSKSWTQSQAQANSENWSQGVSEGTTKTSANTAGVSHSETESSSETYGTSNTSSEANNVNFSSQTGSNWGWNKTKGLSETEMNSKMGELSGSVSTKVSASVTGEGSVPGFAKVSGTVGTEVGVSAGAKVGVTSGKQNQTNTQNGEHMYESEQETNAFGSTTTDSKTESVSGTYGLSAQNTINQSTTESQADSQSTTFQMGGSGTVTEGLSEGSTESWSETWQHTNTNQELLSYSGYVPKGKCAMVYRQTVRWVRRAQIYTYDLCGVRSLAGETAFTEWTWSPDIAVGGKSCDALPPSNLPKAACFIGCN